MDKSVFATTMCFAMSKDAIGSNVRHVRLVAVGDEPLGRWWHSHQGYDLEGKKLQASSWLHAAPMVQEFAHHSDSAAAQVPPVHRPAFQDMLRYVDQTLPKTWDVQQRHLGWVWMVMWWVDEETEAQSSACCPRHLMGRYGEIWGEWDDRKKPIVTRDTSTSCMFHFVLCEGKFKFACLVATVILNEKHQGTEASL